MSDFLRFSSAVGHPSHSFELTPLKPVWNNATPYPSRGVCAVKWNTAQQGQPVYTVTIRGGEVGSLGVGAVVFTLICVVEINCLSARYIH